MVLCKHIFFKLLSISHLLENIISHLVHEILGPLLPTFHLILPICFLLIKHFRVIFLRPKIIQPLFFLLLTDSLFILVIFIEHSLQVFLFLLTLFILKIAFLVHFLSKTVNIFKLLRHLILILFSLSSSFILKLEISWVLIIHYFFSSLLLLLNFPFLKKLIMLLSHLIVKTTFILLIFLFQLLLFDLKIDLFPDQTFTLFLPSNSLFLFFEV